MARENQEYVNTDREIWREREGDYYADSIHVTEQGGIGINCGGHVIVKPVREWHRLASALPTHPQDSGKHNELVERLEASADNMWLQGHHEWATLIREAASALARHDGATYESERAALVAEVGDCCKGSDPLCAGGCLVEKAIRKRTARHDGVRTEALEEAKRVGGIMANVCFNWKQSARFSNSERNMLAGLQHQWDAAICALQSHPLQGDMVMVPREPTEAMLRAIVIAYDDRDESDPAALSDARIIYKAMLAASAPTQQDSEKA